ncbi:uncharacterized protein FIBRA_01045 [Fibroporia radiculosa]|uniref:NADPH-dependent FMN reductase-like domain-containing protein n=1 Tax=Fibroporia radiculosa TaxID=599839 RepID=J4I898_9APHY|nr:uncharacterized protein FIBRA_01045 [Fibroporia radiculosa]CCL99036.1 predicted protein [Fibroporia radiculosa]
MPDKTIALMLGSARTSGNARGLAAWLTSILDKQLNANTSGDSHDAFHIVLVDPTKSPHPLGPVVDGVRMPAMIRDPALYSSPAVREWSAFISSCSAVVVLTPQYNWGVPGELKNSFDHLYWEWRDKPVLIVTYGGHGGSKCAAQLKDILEGGLKMPVVEQPILITLPVEYIRADHRVPTDAPPPDFLQSYQEAVENAAQELKQLLSAPAKAVEH